MIYVKDDVIDCIAIPDLATNIPEEIRLLTIDYDKMWKSVENKIAAYLKPINMRCPLRTNEPQASRCAK